MWTPLNQSLVNWDRDWRCSVVRYRYRLVNTKTLRAKRRGKSDSSDVTTRGANDGILTQDVQERRGGVGDPEAVVCSALVRARVSWADLCQQKSVRGSETGARVLEFAPGYHRWQVRVPAVRRSVAVERHGLAANHRHVLRETQDGKSTCQRVTRYALGFRINYFPRKDDKAQSCSVLLAICTECWKSRYQAASQKSHPTKLKHSA